jgi:replicative DNA helicase
MIPPPNPFNQTLDRKLRNEDRERQLIAKFIHTTKEQVYIVERIPLVMIDSDSPRRKMYRIILDMFNENKAVNYLSVKEFVKKKLKGDELEITQNELEIIADTDHYDSLDNIYDSLEVNHKNRIIFKDILERVNAGFFADVDPNELLDDIAKSIAGAEAIAVEKSFAQQVKEAKQRLLNPSESDRGLKLGIKILDNTYGGVIKDRYWTIGAESGNGKTALLVNILVRLCQYHKEKIALIFFSMEMSEDRIIERMVSCLISMSSFKMNGRNDALTEMEVKIIEEAYRIIEDWPITLIYKTQTVNSIKKTFRRFAMENKDKHLIGMVDHIGKVEGNEERRVLTINASQAFKSFCMDYKATMFILSQLKKELSDPNNSINQKTAHRPNESHLMESGAIKADSDNLVLLWRPEFRFNSIVYNDVDWDCSKKAILINEKNRDGQSPNDMIVSCQIQYNQFNDLIDPFGSADVPFKPFPKQAQTSEQFSEQMPQTIVNEGSLYRKYDPDNLPF